MYGLLVFTFFTSCLDALAIADGDGLSDGFEAGESIIDANGKTYYKQRSDPTKADTDGDGLDDYLGHR